MGLPPKQTALLGATKCSKIRNQFYHYFTHYLRNETAYRPSMMSVDLREYG